jgi:hypothetical protein
MLTPELWAILITAVVEIAGLIGLGWIARRNSQTLQKITAAVRVTVLQGRRTRRNAARNAIASRLIFIGPATFVVDCDNLASPCPFA